ncbi:MAG: sugar kinase [Candidatus Marinimicrobia bacterium]|nr:sugar kinase [Candidatus Neomarinimicrobiota bacterium]
MGNIHLPLEDTKSKLPAVEMKPQSIVAVGSIAVDWLELPDGIEGETVGGSLTYFTRSAGSAAPVNVVGIIGTDFPKEGAELFEKYGENLDDLQIKEGDSFRWGGRYHNNWEDRTTLYTELGVFETFNPLLGNENRRSSLFYLGNIHPALQLAVVEQIVSKQRLIVCDTMNLWINTTRKELDKLLSSVDVLLLNESEAALLTETDDIASSVDSIQNSGPENVIIKRGGAGATLFTGDDQTHVPVYPIERLADPTGAGDSFGGGFMAALANGHSFYEGIVWGTATASFCVEGFGLEGLERMTSSLLEERIETVRTSADLG